MTRRRTRVLRRVGRTLVDTAAVVGAGAVLVLIVAGMWIVTGGDIVLAGAARSLP